MSNYESILNFNREKLSLIHTSLVKKFKENTITKEEAILAKYIEFTLHYILKGGVGVYRAYNSKSKYVVEFECFHKEGWDFRNAFKDEFKAEGFKLYKFPNGEWIEYLEVEKMLSFVPKLYEFYQKSNIQGCEFYQRRE